MKTSPSLRKRARKYISLREKLAAALSMLLPQEQRDELRDRKAPASEIIALFQQDHNILHALGGEDKWFNLTPLLKAPHREKSRRDTSIVAKVKRVTRDEARHKDAMYGKHDPVPLPAGGIEGGTPITAEAIEDHLNGMPWPKRAIDAATIKRPAIRTRGFADEHRPMRSRNTFERRKK